MSKNLMSAWLGAAALALLGVCLYQRQESQRLRARQKVELEQAQAQIAKLEAKLAAAERKGVTKASPAVAAVVPRAGARAVTVDVEAAVAAQPAPAKEATVKEAPAADLAKMLRNPGMKEMIRAQQKGQQEMLYGSLFKCLQLTDEEMGRFKELLLDRQMALVDSSMEMMSASATAEEKKAAAAKVKELSEAFDAQFKELLGDDNYGLYKSFEETQAERMQVTMFKGSLGAADQLSDEQEDGLIRAMHEARSGFAFSAPDPSNPQAADPSQFTPEGIEKILADSARLQEQYVAKAADLLTPAQLEQFKASQKQQQAMQEMGMRMAAKMFGPGKPGAAAEKK